MCLLNTIIQTLLFQFYDKARCVIPGKSVSDTKFFSLFLSESFHQRMPSSSGMLPSFDLGPSSSMANPAFMMDVDSSQLAQYQMSSFAAQSQCLYCSKQFENKHFLREHITTVHADEISFSCDTCGKRYMTKQGLVLHKQTHEGKKFKCPLCDALFAQKVSVKVHLKGVHKSKQCLHCSAFLHVDDFGSHICWGWDF